jgi:hypothetical protein
VNIPKGYKLVPVEPAGQNQGEPVACPHEWTDDGEFTLTCTKCDKTENHEPYGWVQTRGNAINHFTQEWDVVESWEDQGFEYKAMFDHAEQPAPVAVVIRRAQEGQPLDGKILTGIGHDSQKTAFELANELADQQVQAKIIQQGIPADGKSARELLLAKMNIKREPVCGAEKRT